MRYKDVAIIGMACFYPSAPDIRAYWNNITSKVNAIQDVPDGRWDAATFYDPDPDARDRVYSKKGGYLPGTIPFNPLRYGVMPIAVEGGEPDQFLVLRVAYEAMQDAGYLDREFNGERAEFILGRGNYLGAGLSNLLLRGQWTELVLRILRALHPESYTEEDFEKIRQELQAQLPHFLTETAPALIPNMTTGRTANRLGFMGPNFTLDAACASSLFAVDRAVQDLRAGRVDLAMAGGVHVFTDVPFLMVFGGLRALSFTSTIRPYDRRADGTMPGEGVGIVVLKRLEDAERDNDRIYAVIKGAGSSSDGRAVSVTAPRPEGEEIALARAYENAELDPQTVALLEGHGTATTVGDAVELRTMNRFFGTDGTPATWRKFALGTIKSMIGHAMPAAGAAGIIKTALALHHRILPPSLNCEEPHEELKHSPIYVNTETRPWIHGSSKAPRRAGVSAFGFGGANAHVVLEEYTKPLDTNPHISATETLSLMHRWDSELLLFLGTSREEMIHEIRSVSQYLQSLPELGDLDAALALRDLAYTLNTRYDPTRQSHRLAIVASDIEDLQAKLGRSNERLQEPERTQIKDAKGIYFFEQPSEGKLAFLFPGEGAQYLNMHLDLCLHFPEVRACFDRANFIFDRDGQPPPSYDVFPPPFTSEEERHAAEQRLWQIDRATTAIITADAAVYMLFKELGLVPDMMAGHSAGEWVGMAAAGIFELGEFVDSMKLLDSTYRSVAADTSIPEASMVAVGTDCAKIAALTEMTDGEVYVANDNCPHQVVIVAAKPTMETMLGSLRNENILFEQLPYRRGYHTPIFTYMCDPLRQYFSSLKVSAPNTTLYCCTTADVFPDEPAEIIEIASLTFARPLEFQKMIERMYADGARTFVELGPKGNLTAFVDDILRGRPHLALATDIQRRSGITQLNHVLGLLTAEGYPAKLDVLYRRRQPRTLSMDVTQDFPIAREPGEMDLHMGYPILAIDPARRHDLQSKQVQMAAQAPTSPPTKTSSPQSPSASQVVPSVYQPDTEPIPPSTPSAPTGATSLSALETTDSATEVMQEYLRTMEHFLEVQEEVMQACFTGSVYGVTVAGQTEQQSLSTPVTSTRQAPSVLTSPEQTAQTPSPSALAPEAQAVAIAEAPPQEPDEKTTIAEQSMMTQPTITQSGSEMLQAALLQIVSDKTGYPQDMLGLDLDMEADLGIDSIKRIEILGTLQEQHGESIAGEVDMEEIAGLKTLREVLDFLESNLSIQTQEQPQTARSAGVPVYPLVGEITSFNADKELTSIRRVHWDEDLFIHDHTFGHRLSDVDEKLRALPVVPMTVSIEMMAEAASLLIPDKCLVSIQKVTARRWIYIELEEQYVDVALHARLFGPDRVHVKIYSPDSPNEPSYIDGICLFGDEYSEAPLAEPLNLTNARPPRITADEMYTGNYMFHGAEFQGITSMDQIGEDGMLCQLDVLPTNQLFRSVEQPTLLTDPCLFDAAGQMVGYWPLEYLTEGRVLFPIGIEELQLFQETPPAGTRVSCQMRQRKMTPQQISADLDIVLPDGRVWMRVFGWTDWRFYWSDTFHDFCFFTNKEFLTEPLPLPDPISDIECRVLIPFDIESKLWRALWAHLMLNKEERREYCGMDVDKRRTEWLLGRAAAKDVSRKWLKRHHGMDVYPADVEIHKDPHGRPLLHSFWMAQIPEVPSLSLAHSGGIAVAAVGLAPYLGVDIEALNPSQQRTEKYVMTESEQRLLDQCDAADRQEWLLRFWCAKEAAAKATGKGMIESIHTVLVQTFNVETGTLHVVLGAKLAALVPDIAGVPLVVYTYRKEGLIIAVTKCETA